MTNSLRFFAECGHIGDSSDEACDLGNAMVFVHNRLKRKAQVVEESPSLSDKDENETDEAWAL